MDLNPKVASMVNPGSTRTFQIHYPLPPGIPSHESFAKIHIDLDLPLFGIAYKKESNKAVLLSLVATLNHKSLV